MFHLAKEYIGQGHEVLIITSDTGLDKRSRLAAIEIMDGLSIKRFKSFMPAIGLFKAAAPWVDIYRCKSIFTKHGFIPDIIITRNYITGMAALKAGFKNVVYLVPGIVKYQDREFIQMEKKDSFVQLFKKWYQKYLMVPHFEKLQVQLLQNASGVFVFSKNMFQQVLCVAPDVHDKLFITKPGVDIARFNTLSRNEARKKTGLSDDRFIFLILCRLAKHKSVDIAIEAFAKMKNHSSFQLLIVGDGPEKADLLEQVIRYGLTDNVIFTGNTTAPETYYSAANVFLLPSVYEPFGQVIIEALFSGLPVIAFDSKETGIETATNEIVHDHQTGILCKYSVEAFTNAMEEIVQYPLNIKNKLPHLLQEYNWKKLSLDLLKQNV